MKNEIPVKDGYELYEGQCSAGLCSYAERPLIAVSNSGNRYQVIGFEGNCGVIRVWKVAAEEDRGIYSVEGELAKHEIDHFEVKKLKPKMPDSPGLWKDKEGSIWMVDEKMEEARCIWGEAFWRLRTVPVYLRGLENAAPFTRCTLTDENGEEI